MPEKLLKLLKIFAFLSIFFGFHAARSQNIEIYSTALDATIMFGTPINYCSEILVDTLTGIQPTGKAFGIIGWPYPTVVTDPDPPGLSNERVAGVFTGRAFLDLSVVPASFELCYQATTRRFPVTVTYPDVVTLDPFANPYCTNDLPFFLSGGNPAGGYYTVNGTVQASFDPGTGAGDYSVYYYTGIGECLSSSPVQVITVEAIPTITFNPMPTVCLNAPPFTLNYAVPGGGTYTGPGVSGNVFYPSVAGVGTHTITYTVDNGTCTNYSSRTITVQSIPIVSFIGLDSTYCDTDPVASLLGSPMISLGVFTGAGITDNGNGTASFDPSAAGLGIHQITYTVTYPTGCSDFYTQQVRVGTLITFSGLGAQYCADHSDVTFTYEPAGGTFSATTGLTDNFNGTATMSPGTGAAGNRTISYSYNDIYGCVNYYEQDVLINAIPTVNFTGLDPVGYCKNGDTVIFAGNHAPLGTFSGPGMTDNGNGTGTFNPKVLPVGGPYQVTYTYTDAGSGCDNSTAKSTNVLPLPTATITGAQTICYGNSATLNVDFTGTGPFDFTYTDSVSSNDITGAGDPYSLVVSPTESSTFTIPSVTQANGCSNTGTGEGYVTVNPLVEIVTNPTAKTVCPDDNVTFVISATGVGLSYQWQKDGVPIPGKTNTALLLNNVVPADAGSYTCVVSSTCGGPLTSAPADLTILPETVITMQPSDVVDCEGENTSINAGVTGSSLTYRWRKNGVDLADGGRISGSGTDNLIIASLITGDAGVYTALVTGDCGSEITDPATLTVQENIVINTQPVSKSVCPGNNTSFSVSVSGTNPTYQWKHNNVDIPGAINPTLILSGVDATDDGTYRCVITGSCNTVSTDLVTLTVYEPAAISLQPDDFSTCEGTTADFNIIATGSNLTYQWQQNGTDLVNGGDISGANSANLSISNLALTDAGAYACIVTGNCGSVTSATAILTVDEDIVITTNPTNKNVCPGDNVIFTSVASGSNLLYQWNKDGATIPGETNNSLVLSAVDAGDVGTYFNTISNACGSVTTNLATLSLYTVTSISTQPVDATICEGDNTSFSTIVTGSNMNYQWTLNGTPIADGGSFSGTNTSSLLVNSATVADAGVFICEISASCGDVNSDPAQLTVNENISISTQPQNKNVCPGNNVVFEVVATGTNLSYQWQKGGVDIPGETNTTLLLSGVTDAEEGLYRCMLTGDCGISYTNSVSLNVYNSINILTNPVSQQHCEGNNATFTVLATGTGLSYQWRKNGVNLVNDGRITGAQSNTLNISNLVIADQAVYSCNITSTCGSSNSLPANLTVYESTNITVQPVIFEAVENGNASFSVSAGGESLTYQWYKDGAALSNDAVYSGVTTSILTLTNLNSSHAGSYYCIVTGTCGTVNSDPGLLVVNLLTLITTHPTGPLTKCVNESVSFDVVAAGTNLTYQWRKDGIDLSDDGRITGSNTPNLNIDNLIPSDEGSYSCLVTGDEGVENSFPASLFVNELTDITQQPLDGNKCEGDDAIFVITAAGNITSYQWQKDGVNLSDNAQITGSDTETLSITNLTVADSGVYTCIVTGVCGNDVSNPANLAVSPNTVITSHPVTKTRCTGTSATFSVVADGGNIGYQWKKNGVNMVNGGNISGVNSPDLTIANITTGDGGVYTCAVTGTCGVENSNAATLTVSAETFITTQPTDLVKCEGDDAFFIIDAEGLSLIYEWRKDGVALSDDAYISGSATTTLYINTLVPADEGTYQVFVTGTCGSYLSDPADLLINDKVQIISQPSGGTKCYGESITLSIASSSVTDTYQWKKNGINISDGGHYSGATTANLTISTMDLTDAGVYSCLVTGLCDNLNSSLANVTVLPTTNITIQPLSQNIDEGDPVTFTVNAVGDNLTYQWQKDGVNLSDNAIITGSTTNVLSLSTVTTGDEGSYTVIVTGTCGNSISDPAVMTVNVPTVITSHPVNQILCEGQSAVFSVTATGSNITYEWRKDGVPVTDLAGKISGSSTQNLSISDVNSSDIAVYTCLVTGGGGALNSNTASLTVHPTTALVSQPAASKILCTGENAYFTVEADGDNLVYSWEKDGVILANGGNIAGATSDILTVSSVTTADAGIYRAFISGTCGNVSTDPSTMSVNELPGVPGLVTGDDLICQGEGAKAYEISPISNTVSYEWSLPYGATIISGDGSRYIVVDYALDAIGGDISVHGRNSCGVGPESAPLTVTVNTKPLADAGLDQNVCSSSSTLNGNNTVFGTWSRISGFATFTNANQYNTTVTNLGQGPNILQWTVTENNCTTRDTVVITNNIVTLDAGQDQVLCGLTATLNATDVTAGTGQWSIKSGGANFVNFHDPKTSVINLQRGTNVLKWSVNNNGCITSDTVQITNDLPTIAIAGTDTIIFADTYTLQGNTPGIGTGTWSLVSGVGVVTSPNDPASQVTNLGIGENLLKWTITNNLCYSEDEVKVINYTPTVTDAGPDQTLCSDNTALFGTPPTYGTGQWTIVQGSGSFSDASKYDSEVFNLGKGLNIFRWTIYEYEITFDDVRITNNSPYAANAGIDQVLCSDATILSGNDPIIGTGLWTIAGGSALIDDDSQYNSPVTSLNYGSNTFRWTITNGTCSTYDEVVITNNLPTPSSAGIDQTTCADSVTLYPNTPSIGTGEWSVVSGSGYFVGNKAYGLGINDNQFKWTITNNGCTSSDTVVITSHKPTTAALISSKSICADSLYLPGNTPQYGTGLWTILSGSGALVNASDPNTLARNLAPGLNKFRWTISYAECTSFAEINVSYDLIPSNAGTDQELCDNTTIMTANTPDPGVGQWSIVGGSGSANFANSDQPNTLVTDLDRGDNILRWTITNKGCISYDEVTITNNNPSTAYAGADRSVCGESFFLNANKPNIGTGEWSVLSGAANILDPNNANSEVNNLSLGQNTLRWTVTNENCASSDEVIITNDQPTNVSAGTDQYLCDDSTQLYSSEPTGGFGRWSIASGSASFSDNTLFNTSVYNLEQGENKLVWTVTIAGCSNTDTVVITNNLPSMPSAGPDQDNCASETFMAANIPQIGTGKWSVVSGSAAFEDPNDPLTKITDIGNGSNLLRWTTTNSSCNLSDEVYIINSLPTIAYAGEDRAVCNTTANLLANPPTTGTGTWKVVSGYGVIVNPNDYNTQIDNLGFGPNTLRWTTENGRCKSSDDVIIKNNLATAYAGLDEIVYSSTITLVGNKPSSGTGEWQLVAGLGDIQTPGNFETQVINLGEGANTFFWTINNEGCVATDDVIITYYVLPEVDFTPSPQSGCPPLTVDFINGSIGGNPFTWEFGDGSSSTDTNPMHTYTVPGKYTVRLTGTGPDGIMVTKDTVVIVREQPDAELEVTPNLIYISDPPSDLDTPVNFFTLTEDVDSVVWDFGDGVISYEINPVHHYTQTGVFDVSLEVITGYQCYDTETILNAVTVERKGSINCPNAFTPNLDGTTGGFVDPNDYSNDVFHCYAEGLLEYRLEIYNRLGILIFESDDINVGWDGYFKNEPAEEGVYVYQVSGVYNNGEKFSKIGSVILLAH